MPLHRRTFLKQLGLGAAGLNFAGAFHLTYSAEAADHLLLHSTPEAAGVSSAGILSFLQAVAGSKHEFHGFVMVRHGGIIAEGWWRPYRPSAPHMLYSMSKSFTSSAVGFAVTEGLLTTDATVISFFPDDLPPTISDRLAALRVKDLLTMSVGHAKDSTPIITKQENWVKAFLGLPIAHDPGTVFLYNSGATYMLSAIVQKVSGKTVRDYLRPRLFEPLKISNPSWETCPRGINTGGWGLSVQTDSLAKFGQLYLQKGMWRGHQLLPEAWVHEATSFKIQQPGADLEKLKRTSDWHQGYCYQFWRCRHNAFRGDGAFGQYTIVMPDQDAVIAINSETSDMQGILNLVWDHLLPAMNDNPLPADAASQAQLKHTLASLALPPTTAQSSPTAAKISGKDFQIESNSAGVRAVRFDFSRAGCKFTLSDASQQFPVRCGAEDWVDGVTSMPGTPPKITVGNLLPVKVAARGTWQDDNTWVMTWRYYETPHHDTVTCRFDSDGVKIEFLNSIAQKSSSHPEIRPVLTGRIPS
ncbi:MAG TPA: serine hydrolase [Verrucomicrobiae bacterium]|nr:serine hydrolase [Verrucomicrobiae bacterium]